MFNLFKKSSHRLQTLPPKEIYSEYPIGIRSVLLMYYENKSRGADFMRDTLPYNKESDRLQNIIANRNGKGADLEKEGQIDKAIKLYEQNVADFADTPHPYDRLRIIYTKRKQYNDAIRVCQAYIDMSKALENAVQKELGNPELAKQLGQTSGMAETIAKLQKKMEKEN